MRSRLSDMLRFGKPGASLRTRLIYPFVILIVVAVTSTGFLSLYYSGKATENMAWQLMDEIAARIEDRVLMFLDKAHLVNEINARAIESQEINLKNIREQELHFWQQVKSFEYVSYSYVGHADGGFFGARRLANGKLQTISTKTLTGGEIEYFNTDTQGRPTTMSSSLPYYDHKTRPWYKAAIEAGKPTWSPVFIDAGGEGLSITAATPLYDRSKKIIGVLGSSFIFSHINQFLHGLKFGESGQTFIMERSGMLVATSTLDATYTTDKKRIASWESENSKIKQTGKLISDQFGDLDNIYKKQQLIIDVQGEKNFIQMSPVADHRGINWLIVMIIPEKNFMSYIKAVNYNAIVLTLLAIGLTLAVGLTIARSITRPILELNTAAKSLAEGDWSKEVKVDRRDEVGELARSFNLMVKNLQATTVSRDLLAVEVEERKRAEEALRRSEEQYRQIVENASDCISRVNSMGIFTFVNPAMEKLLGYLISDIQGHGFWEFIPDGYKKEAIDFFQDMALRQIKETYFEFPGITKSGETLWIGQVSRRQELAGKEIDYLCISRDITERKMVQEALRESEEKYRLLAENSDDAIFTTDTELRFTYISPAVRKLRGFDPEEAMRQRIDEIMTPASLNAVISEYNRYLPEIEQGKNPTVRIDIEQCHKDGSTVWAEISITTMRDSNGYLTGFVGTSRDITERKRTEAALQASEEKFRQIVGSIPNIVLILDMNLRFTYVSASVQRILGYTPEDAMSVTLDQILTPESLAIAYKSFQERLEANAKVPDPNYVLILELEEYHKNGSTIFLENTMTFLRDANGAPLGILCVAADITERKRSELAIRESERRLADVIDFLPLATMVIDRDGRVSAWNRAMEVITGVNRADILGKGDYEYSIPFYGERRPILIDLVFASEEDLATKYTHIRRERGILTAEAFIPKQGIILIGYASELHDSEGNVVGAIESVHNITDIRRVEAELKEAKKAADAANRSKSAFLANMSHEIRTPMNAILGFAQLMERDPLLSEESRKRLEIINSSGEHLLKLINEILEMSKIEAGRATFVPNTFDLHALIHDVERMFRIRTEARGFRFLVEKVGHILRWVVTDEGKLRQVLINLLGNAVKFTEEGGIALRLRAKDGKADTIDLQFEVEDTGPGMSEEEIGRLFQAFEQTSAGIRIGGTGLGLALSQGFVQIMGGSISVASTIGKGTAFRFEIPVKEGKEDETPLKKSKRRVLRLRPGQREIRVLIADDRETNRQLLSQLLAAAGFPTREVVNGEEAVGMVREWKPQVVLMDMIMPVMDGYEATRRIKASPDIMNTAIIAVTASAFEEDRQRILAAGADGFLAKPFKDTELFENIGRLTGIEYLYQEDGATEKPSRAADAAAMRGIAAALPPELVGQLLAAVERADLDRLNDLVGQLTTDYPTFAQQIHEMGARYQYEELIELFSQGV